MNASRFIITYIILAGFSPILTARVILPTILSVLISRILLTPSIFMERNPGASDAIITSGDTIEKEVVEIKRRNCLHTDYQGEFIIEKDRIERISKCAESFLYINFFNDNKMIIWKIDAFKDYEYITKKCNKKTAINIGQIDKKVLLLKTQDALCIEDLQFTKEEVERVALNHFNKKYINI